MVTEVRTPTTHASPSRVAAGHLFATILLIAVSLIDPTRARAYQEWTHVVMTYRGITGSVLSMNPSILAALPLPPALGLKDLQCTGKTPLAYAGCIAGQGAWDEDMQGTPPVRVGNHFYDYQNAGGSLTAGALSDFSLLGSLFVAPLLNASPAWILDGVGQDASEYGATATYEPHTGSSGVKQDLYNALVSANSTARMAASRQMFLELGHVLHHLQDMAQPQHVRNDNHCNPATGLTVPVNLGSGPVEVLIADPVICIVAGNSLLTGYQPSVYERYVATYPSVDNYINNLPANITLPPVFEQPSDFWTTRYGIAAFTSKQFFSPGTNLMNTGSSIELVDRYPLAAEAAPGPGNIHVAPSPFGPTDLTVYYSNVVVDQVSGNVVNAVPTQYATTQSFVGALFSSVVPGGFSFKLTPPVYQAQMLTLVPQAVKYSQWFVNYLFRGSITGVLVSSGNLKITNNTSTGESLSGTFTLYSDDATGKRSVVGSCPTALTITAGSSNPSGTCPLTLGAAPSSGSYLLVFSGTLGQEANQVAVTQVAAASGGTSPGGFSATIGPGPYTEQLVVNSTGLSACTSPSSTSNSSGTGLLPSLLTNNYYYLLKNVNGSWVPASDSFTEPYGNGVAQVNLSISAGGIYTGTLTASEPSFSITNQFNYTDTNGQPDQYVQTYTEQDNYSMTETLNLSTGAYTSTFVDIDTWSNTGYIITGVGSPCLFSSGILTQTVTNQATMSVTLN